MKNSKKALLSLLCVAFCAIIFACASGGGGAKAASTVVVGVLPATFKVEPHDDSDDKGTSTMVMTVAEEVIDGVKYTTWKFKGTVTDKIQYGVVDAGLIPDDETLARLKVATAISFKMLTTDGRKYNVEAPLSSVTDWGFHRFPVENEPNVVAEHKIDMRFFMQPAWAKAVKFNQQSLTGFRIQSLNAAEGGLGPYEFKVWDFKVYGSFKVNAATVAAVSASAASASSADATKPNFGTPTPFQVTLNKAANAFPINIAGKQVKISFEGEAWRGQVNGADILAGDCKIAESANGDAVITLKQSWAYVDTGKKAPITNTPIASWVKTPGPDIILDYKKGPPEKLSIK